MAGKFSLGDIAKITRHKSTLTIEQSYDPGLRTHSRADMSMAIAQAANLKRGHEFQSISEHLVRKTSHGKVQLAKPEEMVRTMPATSRGSGSSVSKTACSHTTNQPNGGGFDTVQKDCSKTPGSLLANGSETAAQEDSSEEDRSSANSPSENDTADSGFFGTGSFSVAAAQENGLEAEHNFSPFEDSSYDSSSGSPSYKKVEGSKSAVLKSSVHTTLLGAGISYVMLSGFKNGTKGRKLLPSDILKAVVDDIDVVQVIVPSFAIFLNHARQVLFIKCNNKRQAEFTGKLVVARAKGIDIVDSAFLVNWEETGKMPSLAQFPVCLPVDYGAEPTVLPPLQPNILQHATFDTTGDELSFPRPLLATVVEAMGGAFVREGEARPARPSSRLYSSGPPYFFVIGHTTEPKLRVYSDEWLVDMVLKGRKLSPKTYCIEETAEEEYAGSTQPFAKRARQVCQCMESPGLISNLVGPLLPRAVGPPDRRADIPGGPLQLAPHRPHAPQHRQHGPLLPRLHGAAQPVLLLLHRPPGLLRAQLVLRPSYTM
jgi:hypothetical protein